jgi:hypothetical protein
MAAKKTKDFGETMWIVMKGMRQFLPDHLTLATYPHVSMSYPPSFTLKKLPASLSIYCFALFVFSSHGSTSCLCFLEKHPSPGGSSLYFPSQQGALLLHGLHEEALRRNDRLDPQRAQLPGHAPRGRTLPQGPAEARIKASDGQSP